MNTISITIFLAFILSVLSSNSHAQSIKDNTKEKHELQGPASTNKVTMPDSEKAIYDELAAHAEKYSRLQLQAGDIFPSFSLPSTKSNILDNKLFQGKITLINFFFNTCAPCIKEIPELNSFSKNHPNIQVLAMTFDNQNMSEEYAMNYQFDWIIAYDAREFFKKSVGVSIFPSFALVNEDGRILGIAQAGKIPIYDGLVEKGLVDWIAKLTDGKAL